MEKLTHDEEINMVASKLDASLSHDDKLKAAVRLIEIRDGFIETWKKIGESTKESMDRLEKIKNRG